MKEYKAKINGRGKLKLYDSTPKFFCVLDIENIGEKKSMITVSNYDQNGWGTLISDDKISTISKGDTVIFNYMDDIDDKEWLNINSLTIEILDDSGTKQWIENRERYKKEMKEKQEKELEIEREKRRIEKEKRIKERKELYKKYQDWYFKEYNTKTTGFSILLMFNTLKQIEHGFSLIGIRGEKGFYTGDSWSAPTGLHANVFHELNKRIVNKALNELKEKKFVEFKLYPVIFTDPYTKIKTNGKAKGIQITEEGKNYLVKFGEFYKNNKKE